MYKCISYVLAALPLDPHDAQQVRPVLGRCRCCCCKLNTRHLIPVSATPCSQPLWALCSVTRGIGSGTDIRQLSNDFNSKDISSFPFITLSLDQLSTKMFIRI